MKTYIRKHKSDLPTGGEAYYIGNTSKIRISPMNLFNLRKPTIDPKYGEVFFRREGGSFFYNIYSDQISLAERFKSSFYDYLLYDGGHELIEG
jgi:hypothetical protein